MRESADPPKFVPREPATWWMRVFGEHVVLISAFALWGTAGWATWVTLHGHVVLGALAFVAWLPVFLLVARAIHLRGWVRLGVSITSTAIVILSVGALSI